MEPQASDLPTTLNDTPPPASTSFRFHGRGGELALLILENILKTLLTVGIYYPWAKTRVRRYLWSHTSLDGHRFDYTGNGKEIFKGYLKVLAFYLAFILITPIVNTFNETLGLILNLGFSLVVFVVFPFIIFGAHRYKTTRTRYRGIALVVDVNARKAFAKRFYIDALLSAVSLGLYLPVLYFNLHRGLIKATYYGDLRLDQTGDTVKEWKISITNVLLTIITFYLFLPWATLRKMRYRLHHIKIDQAHLDTTMTGLGLAGMFLLSIAGTILTVGLAAPWISTLLQAYVLNHLKLRGQIDFARIRQAARDHGAAIGDAGSDVMDLDLGVF